MLHIVKSYLKFLWNSKNQYDVHSPFVFNLATKCFYDSAKYSQYAQLEGYRAALLRNHNTIDVTDFGAGSRVFKSNTRQISQIAKTAGISGSRARLLLRLVNYFESKEVLEIGTSVGLATSALALANKKLRITTVEGCAQTSKVAQMALQPIGANIHFEVSEFGQFLASQKSQYDLIYFDGNHQKDATLQYFETLLTTAHNDTLWIFDDIHWSPGMEQAWEQIKLHPQVTVTIDTFQWGLVFFRREQMKQDFVIRV